MRQPTPFGRYILLERISVGGMAEVFKAKPLGPEGQGRLLAIKRILPSMAEDADFIQMFIDEAKISGQLNHGNIAQIYELGRVEDSHFIAMEFVWGKDLLQIQNRYRRIKQTMNPVMAAYIAAKMTEGLDYAHKKADAANKLLGIIHRDVSPQNILVSYDGEVKVIDFGIAKAASRSTKTQAGVLKGKFGYMSPEQVRGLPLDRRSDVFAIATILYELLTAERLFLGESDFATLEKVRAVDVPPPSKVCPACPPELERIILKGLARDVEDRYQWGSEMVTDLRAFLETIKPPYTSKLLAGWMREQFSTEMKREGAIIEEQRRLDAASLLAGKGTAAAAQAAPVSVSLVTAPLPPVAAPAAGAPDLPAGSTNMLSVADLESVPDDGGWEEGGATLVTGPGGLATLLAGENAGGVDEALLPSLPVAGQPAAVALANESTRILDDVKKPAASDLQAQATMMLEAPKLPAKPSSDLQAQATMMLEAPKLPAKPSTDLQAQATMMLEAPKLPPAGQGAGGGIHGQSTVMLDAPKLPPGAGLHGQSTVMLDAPKLNVPRGQSTVLLPAPNVPLQSLTTGGERSQIGHHPETSHVSALPYAPVRRSTLGKDILIGVAVAVLLVGGVLGGRALLARERKGTLVVTVTPATAATVIVDNKERGQIQPGTALTLKDVSAGVHSVKVKTAAGTFDQQVSIVAGDVSVVNAAVQNEALVSTRPVLPEKASATTPTTPDKSAVATVPEPQGPPKGLGHLRLKIKTAGAAVYVDGAQLDDDAAKEEIPLKGNMKHELRVTEAAHDEVKFTVVLQDGEKMTKEIDLPVPAGHLSVVTDPPGADVNVNSKSAGTTPLKLDNLDPNKDARVSIRKHGYATVTKMVSFSKDHNQSLDIKLTAGGGGSSSSSSSSEKVASSDEPGDGTKSRKETKESKPGKDESTAKETKEPKETKEAGSAEDGYLVANTQPWAKVLIDGKDTGKTTPIAPRSKIALKPGKHVVTFVANGKSYNFDVLIKAGEDARLIRQLTDTP